MWPAHIQKSQLLAGNIRVLASIPSYDDDHGTPPKILSC